MRLDSWLSLLQMHPVFDKTEESALYWKGKVVAVSDMKKRRASSGMAPLIPSLRTS